MIGITTVYKSLPTDMGDPKFNSYWISPDIFSYEKIIMNTHVLLHRMQICFPSQLFLFFPRTSSKHLNQYLTTSQLLFSLETH